ncbi:hypothetical protein TSUD_252060 [Trifolium subterraneum]|uniref:Retrotransposon Copia-like N-terminal domain-containing protein n=1 Tax=Trifolium subterraneum TaxID=3900 RepID=A0A2Z6LVU9_TRISU|nr:hypothetical protein TSUD_252060 [Trifolium subterraneum]
MANPFNIEGVFTSSQTKIANLISVRLDDKNFKQWKQQVSGVIRGFSLQKYITNPVVLEQFLFDADHTAGTVNPLYQAWENQDALDEIHRHFETLLNTKARQLRSELRTLSKGDRKIEEFIQRVRMINESLISDDSTTLAKLSSISIGDHVPHRNLIEIVLNALPKEYDSVVVAVASNASSVSLDELESHLLGHESLLEKNKKQNQLDAATVNLAQSSPSLPSSQMSTSDPLASVFLIGTSHINAHENQGGGWRGGRSGSGGRYGGRGGRGTTSCEICHKNNHDASYCRFRYSTPSQGYGYGYGYGFGYRPQAPQASSQFPMSYGYGFPRPSIPPAPQAMLTGGDPNFSNQWWYPDSGAFHHVTPDPSNLSDTTYLLGSDQVLIGNGQVPAITKNLMSVSKFAQDNNVFFEFHPTFCLVKS